MTQVLNIIWNPSEGIDLGFFMIRYYSLMFVIAFGLGWYLMKKIFEREGESIDKLDSLFVWTVLATLFGARLGQILFYDENNYFRNHPLEMFLPIRENEGSTLLGFIHGWEFTGFQGLASHGAAIGIIIAMYFYNKKILHRSVLWILDRIVIPVASGAVFVRIGNLMNSEIIGHETTSVFGIRFLQDQISKNDAVKATGISNPAAAYNAIATDPNFSYILRAVSPKHPTQLYEAFCYVFVFATLYFLYWKTNARLKSGFLFGLFLVLLFTIRFVVEFVKESQGGFEKEVLNGVFSTGQLLSIPLVIVGFFFIIRSQRRDKFINETN